MLVFEERGRAENPANNLSEAKETTNNKLNPHMASTPGVEPRPHWREVSALTTTPPLLPKWVRIFCIVVFSEYNFLSVPVKTMPSCPYGFKPIPLWRGLWGAYLVTAPFLVHVRVSFWFCFTFRLTRSLFSVLFFWGGLVLSYKRVIIIRFEMNRAKKGDVWDKPVK